MVIKKNDMVIVLTGQDKGKKGKVIKAMPKEGRVIVEGVNMQTKHQLIDKKTGEPTRVGFKIEGDRKIRISRKSGEEI